MRMRIEKRKQVTLSPLKWKEMLGELHQPFSSIKIGYNISELEDGNTQCHHTPWVKRDAS